MNRLDAFKQLASQPGEAGASASGRFSPKNDDSNKPSASAEPTDGSGPNRPSGDDAGGAGGGATSVYVPTDAGADMESGVVTNDANLEKALGLIEEIRSANRKIKEKTIQLKQQVEDNKHNFDPNADGGEANEKFQTLVDEIGAIGKEVKGKLDDLDKENKRLMEDAETMQHNAATVKIQQNQHNHLTRQFITAIGEYHEVVNLNERQLRDQMVSRIRLKHTNKDGSTVSEERARELAQEVIQYGESDTLYQSARGCLDEVLETRRDVKRMEQSVYELMQMINDFSALVTEQGEVMDVIAENVHVSLAYVKGTDPLFRDARGHAEATRSCSWWWLVLIIVLFSVVLASVLGATLGR